MKKTIWIFNIVVVTFIVLSMYISVAVAQPLPYSLSGHIYDNESNYIVGADITLLNKRTGDTLNITSTTDGEYQTDAYNFLNHYKNNDKIEYIVTYKEIGATEKAKIDISKGGTKLDIVLTIEDSQKTTPNPTPRKQMSTRKSVDMYVDTDGDGISDNVEKIKGTNLKDACDPNPNCTQCIVKRETPEIFSPVEVVTTPLPIPVSAPIAQTPRATPKVVATPIPKMILGFTSLITVLSLFVIVFLVKRK